MEHSEKTVSSRQSLANGHGQRRQGVGDGHYYLAVCFTCGYRWTDESFEPVLHAGEEHREATGHVVDFQCRFQPFPRKLDCGWWTR